MFSTNEIRAPSFFFSLSRFFKSFPTWEGHVESWFYFEAYFSVRRIVFWKVGHIDHNRGDISSPSAKLSWLVWQEYSSRRIPSKWTPSKRDT